MFSCHSERFGYVINEIVIPVLFIETVGHEHAWNQSYQSQQIFSAVSDVIQYIVLLAITLQVKGPLECCFDIFVFYQSQLGIEKVRQRLQVWRLLNGSFDIQGSSPFFASQMHAARIVWQKGGPDMTGSGSITCCCCCGWCRCSSLSSSSIC